MCWASSIITTAKYNRLISVHFDENGELRNKSGLVTTANFSKLFAEGVTSNGLVKKAELNVYVKRDEFGNLVSGVTIKADQIKLEGLVTANGYFKVLTDGSIETRNANISGTVKASGGKIGGFTIDSGRLYWKSRDYFGNDSRSLKLGVSSSSTEDRGRGLQWRYQWAVWRKISRGDIRWGRYIRIDRLLNLPGQRYDLCRVLCGSGRCKGYR